MNTNGGHNWSDQPVTNIQDDRLGRHRFAVRLAESIAQLSTPDSVVIGLFGAWGSGKTTVLKMVESELALAHREDVVVVWFNPWMVGSSEEALVRDFILSVAERIDAKLDNRAERLVNKAAKAGRYARALEGVPAAGKVFSGVAGITEAASVSFGKSLLQFRARLNDALEKSGKKVLVMVDDLDRLSQSHVATMFRVIKAVGEFPHTRYLLAFDRSVVAGLLGDEFGGNAFIEKIVQVPLELPAPASSDLNSQFFERLHEAMERHCVVWTDQLNQQLQGLFPFIGFHVRTPRSAKQLAYIIDFVMPLVEHETNLADLIMVEALRLFEPSVYDYVRKHRDDFLTARTARPPLNRTAGDDPTITTLRNVATIVDDDEDRAFRVTELLRWLFPLLHADMADSIGRLGQTIDGPGMHVSSPEFFDNYFRYGQGAVGEGDVESLVESLEHDHPGFEGRLQDLLQRDAEPTMTKLERRLQAATGTSQKSLAEALSKHAALFIRQDEELDDFNTPFSRLAAAIERLMAADLLSIDSLAVVGEARFVAKVLSHTDAVWNTDPGRTAAAWRALGKRLATDDHFPLFVDERTFAAPMMRACVANNADQRTMIGNWVGDDAHLADTVLKTWCGRVPAFAGTRRWGGYQFNNYDGLASVIDPAVIAAALDHGQRSEERPAYLSQFLAEHAQRDGLQG